MEEELNKIISSMDKFGDKYDCKLKLETMKTREIPGGRIRYLYKLKIVK